VCEKISIKELFCNSSESYRVCKQNHIIDEAKDIYYIQIANSEKLLEYPKRLLSTNNTNIVINGKIKNSIVIDDEEIDEFFGILNTIYEEVKDDLDKRVSFFLTLCHYFSEQAVDDDLRLLLEILSKRYFKDKNSRLNILMDYDSTTRPVYFSNQRGNCYIELGEII
jgi:hypothetical protein